MLEIKKKFLRFLFTLEILLFGCNYVLGGHGMVYLLRLHKEIEIIEQEINQLDTETSSMADRITAWHSHPYFKEKEARERLQMARSQDTIYYVSSGEL